MSGGFAPQVAGLVLWLFVLASRACLEELARPGLSIDDVVLRHELPSTSAEMLLDYADGAKSELIAAGSSRLGRLDRWSLGSVSTDLVRDGRRSVLIVPS